MAQSFLETTLSTIFRADREARDAEAALFRKASTDELVDLLKEAVGAALAMEDVGARTSQLTRLADLCAQVPGPEMVDALISILNDDEPTVRVQAGEALLDVAYERYAEVARAVERALNKGARGASMAELPWIIAEIGEPSALGLIKQFLTHPEAEAVAAGVESLASLGDPAALPHLLPLLDDQRRVPMDAQDLGEEETDASVAELAQAAIDELSPADRN